MNYQVAPTIEAADWRQWLLPFLIALSLASVLILQADSCQESRDPAHGIPAKSTKPMKD